MEISDLDLKQLILQAQAGDPAAFDKLYEHCLTPVYRYIFLRLQNKEQAQDLAQSVFLKVYSSLDKFHDTGKPLLAYLFTVSRNMLIDHLRKRRVKIDENSEDSLLRLPDLKADPTQNLDQQQIAAALRLAIGQLTEDQRDVITLKFIEDLDNAEIADILHKREDAVRQLQSRGLHALRKILNRQKIL